MKKVWSIMLSMSIMLGCLPMMASALPSDEDVADRKVAYTLYVSADANADGDGSVDHPFATIEQAKEKVRTLDKTDGDIVVKIDDGLYELEDTIVFDEQDSGNEHCTIYYEAMEGADPVISGGKLVTDEWTVAEDVDWLGDGLTAYKTTWVRDDKLRAIYVNGQRASMTKRTATPLKAVGTYTITKGQADWAWISGSKSAGNVFDASLGLPADTRNPQNIELESGSTWVKSRVCADTLALDANGNTQVNFQMPYAAIAQNTGWGTGYNPIASNDVSNVFEWLSAPGEFYFDQAGSTLYYIPRTGEDMATAEVIVPELETLIDIQGSTPKQDYAQYITFRGLTFAHSDWNLQEVAGSHGNATVQACTVVTKFANGNWHDDVYRSYDVPPAAIHVTSAHDIALLDNRVTLTGYQGIHLENDVYDCEVTGNYIGQTGGSGVVVGHPQHVYENDTAIHQVSGADKAGPDKEKFQSGTEVAPYNVYIRNNYLLENCYFFPGCAPITSFFTRNMWVEHNFVYKCSYSGMSIGWGWCNFDGTDNANCKLPGVPTTTSRNNHINYNRIEEICALLHDGGGIYSLGQQGNEDWSEASEANGNYINCFRGKANTNAVHAFHPDEGSAYITFDSNVTTNAPSTVYELNDWQRKHDLIVTNGYSNSSKSNTAAPNCSLEQYVNENSVWPQAGSDVVLYSGLEDEYTYMVTQDVLPDSYYELASNVKLAPGNKLHRRGLLAAEDEVWLAPKNTTTFAEGPTMTKAAGNAKEMAIPETQGDYTLYIRYADGTTAVSPFTMTVSDAKDMTNVINGRDYDVCLLRPLTLSLDTDNYQFTLNGKSVADGAAIDTAGSWVLTATPRSGGSSSTITFTTSVTAANRLLPQNVTVTNTDTVTFAAPLNDPTKTIWLAPSGLTAFDENDPTQSKADGDDVEMTVPQVAGDYCLTVVNAEGKIESQSDARVSVREVATNKVPVDGLGIWLSADHGVTLADDGKSVLEWESQWTNAVLKPTNADTAPQLSVNEHGAPTLTFDGVNDILSYEGVDFNDKSELTIIMVTKYSGPSNGLEGYGDRYAALFVPETGSWGSVIVSPYHDQVITRFGAGQSRGFNRYVRPSVISSSTITTAVKNGTTEYIYVDGEKVGESTDRFEKTANNGTTLYLGKAISGGTDFFYKGTISEVLIYDRALTEEEISSVNEYLEQRYLGVEVSLDSLSVEGPAKTTYALGEELDLSGLTVTAHYGDGSQETIDLADCRINGYSPTVAGRQIITVRYGDHAVSFAVTVLGESAPTDRPIRIACVGDSITEGGMASSKAFSYPSQLQNLLGDEYEVGNFGVGGRCLLKNGDMPYTGGGSNNVNNTAYMNSQSFQPDYVIIMLGSNDSKTENWNSYKQEFASDLRDLIETYRALESHPVVIVATTPTMLLSGKEMIPNEIVPLQKRVAAEMGCTLIDIHTLTDNMEPYFADGVHFNDEGYARLARMFYDGLMDIFPRIKGFAINGVDGVIDDETGTVTLNLPYKTDLTALEPIITLTDGATVDKTGAQDFTNPIPYTVMSTYGKQTKTYTVTVTASPVAAVAKITLLTPPRKTDYLLGERLDTTGATIDAVYTDGTRETVPVTEDMVSGYDWLRVGQQDLVVAYKGKTASYAVQVIPHGVVGSFSRMSGKFRVLQNGNNLLYANWTNSDQTVIDLSEEKYGDRADLSLELDITFGSAQDIDPSALWRELVIKLRSAERSDPNINNGDKEHNYGWNLQATSFADPGVIHVSIPLNTKSTNAKGEMDWSQVNRIIIQCYMYDQYKPDSIDHYMDIQNVYIVDNSQKPDAPDVTALQATIDKAETIDTGLYSDESVAVFDRALTLAKAYLTNPYASQKDIDQVIVELQTAIDALTDDYMPGDVDGNGKVEANDALLALQAATGKIRLTAAQEQAADVDGTAGVAANDALMILQYATEKIARFPVEGAE